MDRPIIYPLSVPDVTNLLYGWQRTMVALSKLASTVLGPSPTGAWLDGFDITTPGGLAIQVAPGQVYVRTSVDANSYGVLNPDTNQILRQFLLDQYSTFTLAAPTQSGTSITYLVQIGYETVDADEQVLQYFDVSNPNVAFGGPNNSGQAQPTVRQDTCTITLISGAPGPTGSQQQPALSGNGVGGFYVTVAYGQTTLSSSDITTVNASPFVNLKLPYAAGTQVSNTFTQNQTFNGTVTAAGAITSKAYLQGTYVYTTEQGSFLFNRGNTDSTSNVVLRSDGANVHIYPWGVPYGELKFGAAVGYDISINGSLDLNGSISATTGSFSGTVSGANATASDNFVPLGQLDSLIPQLFSSTNIVTGSRSLGGTYTNTTGKPMFVQVTGGEADPSNNTSVINFIVNGNVVGTSGYIDTNGGGVSYVSGMVPPGATYQANNVNSATLAEWVETY